MTHIEKPIRMNKSNAYSRRSARTVLDQAEEYDQVTLDVLFRAVTEAGPNGIYAAELFQSVKDVIDARYGEGKYTWDTFEIDIDRLVIRRIFSTHGSNVSRVS